VDQRTLKEIFDEAMLFLIHALTLIEALDRVYPYNLFQSLSDLKVHSFFGKVTTGLWNAYFTKFIETPQQKLEDSSTNKK
jgi:hypothetical protein